MSEIAGNNCNIRQPANEPAVRIKKTLSRIVPPGIKRCLKGMRVAPLAFESAVELIRNIEMDRVKAIWDVDRVALLTTDARHDLGSDRRMVSNPGDARASELLVVDPVVGSQVCGELANADIGQRPVVGATSLRHALQTKVASGTLQPCPPTSVDENPHYNFKVRCPRLQLLFHEVPKNASSTVKSVLFGIEKDGRLNPYYRQFVRHQKWQAAFPEMQVQDLSETAGLFSFAFLRNPWDRVHSAYHNSGWKFHYGRLTFEQFVDSLADLLNDKEDMITIHLQPFRHFVPFAGNVPAVDFVGRFEHFAADMTQILSAAGVTGEMAFPIMNPSKRRRYREDYSDRAKSVVARLYEEDIELGAYRF